MAAARGRAASQVEHMAAPTRAVQKLQKILANDGPSTHGLQEIKPGEAEEIAFRNASEVPFPFAARRSFPTFSCPSL